MRTRELLQILKESFDKDMKMKEVLEKEAQSQEENLNAQL